MDTLPISRAALSHFSYPKGGDVSISVTSTFQENYIILLSRGRQEIAKVADINFVFWFQTYKKAI